MWKLSAMLKKSFNVDFNFFLYIFFFVLSHYKFLLVISKSKLIFFLKLTWMLIGSSLLRKFSFYLIIKNILNKSYSYFFL